MHESTQPTTQEKDLTQASSSLDSSAQDSRLPPKLESTLLDSAKDSLLESNLNSTESTLLDSAQKSTPQEQRVIKIILGVGIALVLGIIAAIVARVYLGASFKVSALLGIIALLVALWTNKALPLGVVSLLPIILFPSFGILDTKSATANYANPIIYLFLGGFMLATATEKIGLHKIIAKKFLSLFPQNPKGVISALGLASCVLGTALSNSTTAILLLPIALSITQDYFLKMRFLLAVAFGASISGITTPIGSPPNLIFLGFLEKLGFDGISFTTWIFIPACCTLDE